MIPGINLLSMAQRLIGKNSVDYYQNTGRATNAKGVDVSTYAPVVAIDSGSIQAVPRNRFQNMGLDYQSNYVTWFVPMDVIDLQRDFSGDQIVWNGARYTLMSKTDWAVQDGWVYVLAVQVG